MTDNNSNHLFSLEAMASDELEAGRFADALEAQGLLRAPKDLKTSILDRSRHMDVQLVAATNRFSRKAELFFYGLKVGFAVVCSLTAIAAIPYVRESRGSFSRKHAPVYIEAYEKIQEWNGKIHNFSQSFLNLEVLFYD